MFSIVMSAFFSRPLTISSPRGALRSRVTDFLLALNWWKYQGSSSGWPGRWRLPGSPVFGFSILTTSAPSQTSASVQDGPASNCVKPTTRTPSRQSSSTPFIARSPPEKYSGTIARDFVAGKPRGTGVGSRIIGGRNSKNSGNDPRRTRAAVALGWRVALQHFLDKLRVDADLDPGALLLQDHRRPRVAIAPAAVQCLGEFGE